MAIYYRMGTTLARGAFTAFARWEVEGREAIPPKGPLIVVANHLSNADPPVVTASINRRLFLLGKKGLFANPVASSILRGMGVHPLDGEGQDTVALLWVMRLLRQDQAVLLFPEATRSRERALRQAKPGIAYIALKSQAPILPVAITGTEKIPGFWRIAFPLCRIKVRIGQPFTLPVLEGKPNRQLLQHLTDTVMYRVAELLPPSYRGYYAIVPPKAQRTTGV